VLVSPIPRRDATVEQESAHLADQCGSMIDQPLPRAVERLDVLLFEGLLRHEPHVPLLYLGADRLGVITVVLLPKHNGAVIENALVDRRGLMIVIEPSATSGEAIWRSLSMLVGSAKLCCS